MKNKAIFVNNLNLKRVCHSGLSGLIIGAILDVIMKVALRLKGALAMTARLVLIHEVGRYRELSEQRYWLESVDFWGVDGRGATVNEAVGNFLTNLVQYCRDYYQRGLWQLDDRLLQLDHVDTMLAYAQAGKSPAPLFLFKLVPADHELASA